MEPGEDIRDAARRELREEVGLEVADLRLRAVLHESGLVGHDYVVFLFVGESPTRALSPAGDLEVAWHPVARLEELALVEDLTVLLPRLLAAREPLFATEVYDGGDRPIALRVSEELGPRGSAAGEPEGEESEGPGRGERA